MWHDDCFSRNVSSPVNETQGRALERLLHALVDQEHARVFVPAYQPSSGFWFGGGNLIETSDGRLLLCGRYRNFGDWREQVSVPANAVLSVPSSRRVIVVRHLQRSSVLERRPSADRRARSFPSREPPCIRRQTVLWSGSSLRRRTCRTLRVLPATRSPEPGCGPLTAFLETRKRPLTRPVWCLCWMVMTFLNTYMSRIP